MYNKKSIVLNGLDSDQKGILTLQQDEGGVSGNIRLYNFNAEPSGIISLGIYQNDTVIKAGLTRISDMFFAFKSELKIIPSNFSCALINFVGGEPRPLLYGTSDGFFEKEKIFDEVISNLNKASSAQQVENVLNKYGVDFAENEKELIEKEIDKHITSDDVALCANFSEQKCENCEYKKFFMSQVNKVESYAKITNDNTNINENKTFYDEIKDHVDKLFRDNPTEDYLQKLLPNSKFVRVALDENNYYVFGIIYENDEIKYICYGVPGIYQKNPPRQLSGAPVWFPIDQEKPEGFGYWLSYQDAESGDSVKALIV